MEDGYGDIDENEDEEGELEEYPESDEPSVQFSDDSDSLSKSKSKSKPKPKSKPKSKPKPKPKPVEEDVDQPLVEISRIKPKKRLFTQDQFDGTYQPSTTPLCKLCQKPEGDVEGGFISPFPLVYRDERFYVHKACALCMLDVARSSCYYYNVVKSINAGKKVRCRGCGQFGVSLWCSVANCTK